MNSNINIDLNYQNKITKIYILIICKQTWIMAYDTMLIYYLV